MHWPVAKWRAILCVTRIRRGITPNSIAQCFYYIFHLQIYFDRYWQRYINKFWISRQYYVINPRNFIFYLQYILHILTTIQISFTIIRWSKHIIYVRTYPLLSAVPRRKIAEIIAKCKRIPKIVRICSLSVCDKYKRQPEKLFSQLWLVSRKMTLYTMQFYISFNIY